MEEVIIKYNVTIAVSCSCNGFICNATVAESVILVILGLYYKIAFITVCDEKVEFFSRENVI